MSAIYVTRDGDTADYIAWKYYKTASASAVETLLAANKGMADYGPSLPPGVIITLPEITLPETKQGVRLWD